MKHFLLAALFVLLSVSLATTASSQTIDTRRHIEVSATAKIYAEPDTAVWQIKLRGEATGLADASKLLDSSAQSLRQRLAEAGVPAEALRLSGIASGRHYEGDGRERLFKGYFAERSAVIELKDLSRRQALETALLTDDRVEIVQVELRSSRHEALRKESLLSAVTAAKEKAAALASQAGAEVSTVLEIRENSQNALWNSAYANRLGDDAGAGQASLEFEKLQYTAAVTLKLALK